MKKELFVARDQSGVKPFYYFWDNKKFIFSSEIKGILEHPIERVLNRDSFYAYFRLLYVPGPKSIFKDIYKLPIGHYGMLKDNKYELYDYREEISKEVLNLSGKDLEEKVKEEVFNAVKRQMVSDKPVGVFLSGGIDSSSVLACASKLNSKIKTFSSGFDLGDKHLNDKYNLDLQNAGKTARYFGSDHYEIIMKNSEALGILKKMIYHADEPAANATFLSTFYLAEFAKKQVDVVLTGDGGDEIFGGYNRYRMCMAGEYYHYLPSFLRKLLNKHEELKKLNINSGLDLAMQFFYQKRSRFDQVLKNEPDSYNYVKKFFSENLADERGFRTLTEQYMDLESKTWLVYESHLRGDKMTMAHGLEARLPFTDRELIKLAHQIKRKYKVGFFDSKIILKRAFKNDFPEFLTKQPKTGWLSPFKAWVRSNEFELKIKETLTPSFNDKTSELINWKELNSLLKDFSIDSRMFLWSILVFQIWAKEYKIKTF